MAKNLRINDMGMGWPVGTIVPPSAFPHGYAGHLAMGAVTETDAPATAGGSLPEKPAGPSEAEAQNTRLRAEAVEREAKIASLMEANAALTEANVALTTQLAEANDLLEQATAARDDAEAEKFDALNGPAQ